MINSNAISSILMWEVILLFDLNLTKPINRDFHRK